MTSRTYHTSQLKGKMITKEGGAAVDVNERLKEILKERGWSEYRLARECGLSDSTIHNIYRRNASPSIPTLEIICKGFGITMSQFFAEGDMVEMSPELKALFEGWRPLTPQQKAAVMTVVQAFRAQGLEASEDNEE